MKKPIIFFRNIYNEQTEAACAKKHLEITESRVGISNKLVVGRYSVLPFYRELELDLKFQGSSLINSHLEHQYVANFDYYEDVKHLTPKTWFELKDIPKDGGPFILKGKTNSRKHQWKTKMFANNYKEAVDIYCELQDDSLVSDQGIIIRQYVPLKSFSQSLNGMPFANEWRFFFYKEELLGTGYYWTNSDVIPELKDLPAEAYAKAKEVAKILSQNINFFVVDIAETATGEWILIEANDGQMSGLTGVDPEQLYSNLKKVLG